ncbi:MAG: hypothetical protein LUF04_09605 [Bacteroides sp.]|nr:hypothetical protein [Bacteroides sp.]
MYKAPFTALTDSLILSQWVVGKTREEILEMPERFRCLTSELEEDEDIYGELIRLEIGGKYLFCHFRHESLICTKSILELVVEQLDACREYCVRHYSPIASQKWINTEYEVILSFVYGAYPGGYVECLPSQGYKVGFFKKIANLFH